MSKIVALDFGLKRIGVAITDDLNIIASALDTVSVQNIVPFLKKIIEINDIKTIVVGQPRQKDYSPSVVEKEILKFIDVLKKNFPNISLERYDERYTSLMAKKVIVTPDLRRINIPMVWIPVGYSRIAVSVEKRPPPNLEDGLLSQRWG